MPPFRVIESALRRTTERLVRELAMPQSRAPDWNEFEWAVARAASAIQGITALLASRLEWRGPGHFWSFLEAQRELSRQRDQKICALLAGLDQVLTRHGIAYVPLKGSALRRFNLYQPGERPQSDIDVLLHADELPAARAPLESLGYRFLYASRRHEVYVPAADPVRVEFGEHPDNRVYIELHTRISESLPVETVDITTSICPVFGNPGPADYPSFAALMRHLALHTAGNMRANASRFIQLHDLARLARCMTADEWRELVRDPTGDRSWWLFPPLALAERYLPGSIPKEVLSDLRVRCPRRLRERFETVEVYDVSWANLRIPALPGHEWARTLGDSLRFARGRLFPSRVALHELASQTVVAQPHLTQLRWYGVSHAERILRWIFTRTPRVQTLSTVSAALRDAGS
jgi:hypothetical protein